MRPGLKALIRGRQLLQRIEDESSASRAPRRASRVRAAVLTVVSWLGATACLGTDLDPAVASLLGSYPCTTQVAESLLGWNVTGEVLEAPPVPGFERRFRLATATLGQWAIVDVSADRPPQLTRVRAAGVERHELTQDCEALTDPAVEPLQWARESPAGEVFDDEKLRAALAHAQAEGRPFAIYVWSPHMPLSLDGFAELNEASQSVSARLIPVLVTGSDPDFARAEAARVGIPDEGLLEVASLELMLRDANVHAPSILVFKGSRVSPVLPGYRNAEGYRRFLLDFLAAEAGLSEAGPGSDG